MLYIGIVEDRNDPHKLGRVKARIVGVHTDNKDVLPTRDLPWAIPLQNITSAAMSGIGESPTGVVEGTMVGIIFTDETLQVPIYIGTLGGIPSDNINSDEIDTFDDIISELKLVPPTFPPPPNEDGTDANYIGLLTTSNVESLVSELGLENENELKESYTSLNKAGVITPDTPAEKLSGVLYLANKTSNQYTINFVKLTEDPDNVGKKYYNEGYLLILGKKTIEFPTIANIEKEAVDKREENVDVTSLKYDVRNDVSSTPSVGFVDPNGIYPLSSHKDEPDTPRLASGYKINESIVGIKESEVISGIPIANSSDTWSQSPVPYNAEYPFNKVFTSESGHVMEFDDTKGHERINLHHKSGTFKETDNQGNTTDKTKGSRTIIVEKDELVYIKGSGHITIDGDHSLLVKKALSVEIKGDANIKVGGNCTTEVDGEYSLSAKTISLNAETSFLIGAASLTGLTGNIGNPIISAPIIKKPLSKFSTDITIPSPVTRQEKQAMKLEDSTEGEILGKVAGVGAVVKTKDETETFSNIPVVLAECDFSNGLRNETRLSVNYTIGDLSKDGSFPFNGQHDKTANEIACNIKQVVINIVEPLRAKYNHLGFKINSGVRPKGSISGAIGISKHEFGLAVDISFSKIRGKKNDRAEFFRLAQEIKNIIPYDKLILEYRDKGRWVWIHISFNPDNNRGLILTLNNNKKISDGLVELA